ncbi:ABC transporter ATP-binding protein [bacterium 210820-DFI.6.37]|nr:ABC transporter ATP-binding protein [bacterium 210820-DFI.6.37]
MKIELRDVSCGYSDKKNVLEHISFQVNSGEICCLLGPNGVGKTTLFKTVLRLMKPTGGSILIDGEELSKLTPRQMAKAMGYVSQYHVPPFPYVVKDVVMLGRIGSVRYFGQPSKRDYEITEQAMEDMGIRHLRDEVYTDISGGERQLVMIARALAQEPKFLVLDEPTASLDYGNMVRVMQKVKNLKEKGYGVIMTTHSPDQAFMCDSKVALLQRNTPVKFGDAVNIITRKNLYEAYKVDVRVVEFVTKDEKRMRMCAPVF